MGTLIDTSIVIDLERARLVSGTPLFDLQSGDYFLSVVTVSEMLVGTHRGPVGRREKRHEFATGILATGRVLNIGIEIARLHAKLTADMLSLGRQPGVHDLWIAATAIYHDLEVLTRDTHSFPLIPGVRLAAVP